MADFDDISESGDDAPQPFERIDNPYVIGNPIRGGEPFFGREDDLEFARRRLQAEHEGVVLLFVGGRRSGKTSIMYQILDGRLGPEFQPVFIDMQALASVDDDREMLGRMARIVIESIGDQRLLVDYYEFATGNPILTFDRLLADVNLIFPDRRLLFLIDEAELLRDRASRGEITGGVLTFMASALENRGVSFFFTGSAGLAEAEVAEWRRLMGKGDFREITFLSPTDTMRLATEPLGGRVHYAPGVLESIYQLTYGQPFYTQLICTNAVDHLNGQQRDEMTAEDLDEVVRTIVNNPPPQLVYDWEQFSREEQLALSLLSEVSQAAHVPVQVRSLTQAVADNGYPIELNEADLHVILDGLDRKMVLERSEEGTYHFRVDLVRLWVRRNRSVWRLVEEPDRPRPRPPWQRLATAVAVLGAVAVTAVALTRSLSEAPVAPVPPPRRTGSLWLERFPEGTTVTVRGPLDGEASPRALVKNRTPDIVDDLEPGLYTVALSHPLYRARLDTQRVTAGRRDTVAGDFERLRGILSVRPVPAGARVRVSNPQEGYDSAAAGGVEGLALHTGVYTVDVSLAGYRPWTGQVQVDAAGPGDSGVALAPALTADVGTLEVASQPPGATIYLDSVAVGTTPRTLEGRRTGPHGLRLRLAEYLAWDTTVVVRFGARHRIDARLTKEPAVLVVRSTPPQARILVDGRVLPDTVTPERLVRPPGTYRIRLELPGYEAYEVTMALDPGDRRQVAPALQQQFGTVQVLRPFSGVLVVDGVRREQGVLGFVDGIPAGRHELRLEGYRKVWDVEITKGDTETVWWE